MKNHLMSLSATVTFLLVFVSFMSEVYSSTERGLELQFSTLNFADSVQQENVNFQLEADAFFQVKRQRLTFTSDVGVFLASYPEVNFQIPELVLDYKILKNTSISIGRKKPFESLYLDSNWGLSVLQSSFRMEPFNPSIQGLMGIHYNFKAENFYMYGFASPLFIPDQTQTLDRSGDEIRSDNPWASLPPQRVLIEGSSFDVSYDIRNDSLPDLLTQVQFGGAMGFLFDKAKVSAFYYFRPSRQLSFAFEARGTSVEDDVLVDAQVEPQFLDEHLFGLQTELEWLPNLKTQHGAYGTFIDQGSLSQRYNYHTSIDDYFIFSNSIQWKARKTELALSHIHFNRRAVRKDGVVYLDFNRYLHGNAVKVETKYKFRKPAEAYLKTLFDYENKGVFLQSGVNYSYSKKLKFWAELQFLEDLEEASSGSVFEEFEGLDSIRGGISFVF